MGAQGQQDWYNDSQVSQKILTVSSRSRENDQKYVELFSDDLAAAFCSPSELGVLKGLKSLLGMIRSYAYTNSLDLRPAYNMIADYYNGVVNLSRSTGKAVMASKSQYINQNTSYQQRMQAQKKHGFRRLLG